MPPPPPRLEIRNLRRAFEGRAVVDDVSLTIMPGQVTCLLGPSGCGKSTTLRMIAGVEMQDSGEIHVDGQLICDTVYRVPPERREIGLMFQDFALFPHLSVADNVAFGIKTRDKAARRARVRELLERVDLARFIDGYPHQLSGGEQQRVALARALAPSPRALLLDEPTSNLDPASTLAIENLVLAARKAGTRIVLVTHDLGQARRLADEIVFLHAGRVLERAPAQHFLDGPSSGQAQAFLEGRIVL